VKYPDLDVSNGAHGYSCLAQAYLILENENGNSLGLRGKRKRSRNAEIGNWKLEIGAELVWQGCRARSESFFPNFKFLISVCSSLSLISSFQFQAVNG